MPPLVPRDLASPGALFTVPAPCWSGADPGHAALFTHLQEQVVRGRGGSVCLPSLPPSPQPSSGGPLVTSLETMVLTVPGGPAPLQIRPVTLVMGILTGD